MAASQNRTPPTTSVIGDDWAGRCCFPKSGPKSSERPFLSQDDGVIDSFLYVPVESQLPSALLGAGKASKSFRFFRLWPETMRIERCAIPNSATLLVRGGGGEGTNEGKSAGFSRTQLQGGYTEIGVVIHSANVSSSSVRTCASLRPVRAGTWKEWSAPAKSLRVARGPR